MTPARPRPAPGPAAGTAPGTVPGPWRETWSAAISDRISLVAAGCAFYAMLALFPALTLLISFYGIWFDPLAIEPQLEVVARLLPAESFALIAARVRELAVTPRQRLGAGAAVSAAIALWSAASAIRALLGALNLAHRTKEQRGLLAFHATALVLTLGAIGAVAIGLGFLVALPTLLAAIGFPQRDALLLRAASLLLLLLAVLLAVAVLYRFGPARPPPHWRVLSPGAVLATLLWVVASAAFSLYVSNVAPYDRTYGALGAVIALLTWFYVSVYLILLGAELDAALARAAGITAPRTDKAG